MPQPRTARAVKYPNATVLQFSYDAKLVEAIKRDQAHQKMCAIIAAYEALRAASAS